MVQTITNDGVLDGIPTGSAVKLLAQLIRQTLSAYATTPVIEHGTTSYAEQPHSPRISGRHGVEPAPSREEYVREQVGRIGWLLHATAQVAENRLVVSLK
jgi:hypothetical protein